MVKLSYAELHQRMHNMDNIRNISVIAHVDHGKTTVTDTLVGANGIIAEKNVGTQRYTDTRKDEQERCITIKATTISLLHTHKTLDYSGETTKEKSDDILINLIDSPGHIDFSAEVTASLRVTDCALFVVDCTKGVQAQTITVGKQAVMEKVKPVLFVNKFDTLFSTLAMKAGDIESQESAYNVVNDIVQNINIIIADNLKNPHPLYNQETVFLDMLKGNVALGSGKLGWGITIESAFNFLNKKKIPTVNDAPEKHRKWAEDKEKAIKRYWGDNFVNIENPKMWKKTIPQGEDKAKYVRGFCHLVLRVLLKVREMCERRAYDELKPFINDPNFEFPADAKELERKVMRKVFPLTEIINGMITEHLPSPKAAQLYRAEDLSMDPNTDGPTTNAIRKCDPNGPFIGYCSKKVAMGDLARPTIYTVIRVLSGTMNNDMKLLYMDDKYELGETEIRQDMCGKHNGLYIMIGRLTETVKTMPCGNVCGAKGIDKYLPGAGTIVEYDGSSPNLFYPIKNMRYTTYPIVGVRVAPQNISDFSKLIDASKLMKKLDLTCRAELDEGGIVIFGNGPLHVEILVKDISEMFNKPIIQSEQIVRYCETATLLEPKEGMAKSGNMLNRLYFKAFPMEPDFADKIDEVTNPEGFTIDDLKNGDFELTDFLEQGKINSENLKRILMVEDGVVLYNKTQGFMHMDDMKSFIIDGLKKAIPQGPLANEPIRGVQYSINEIKCHPDAIHRGQNQITPPSRAVALGSLMYSAPALCEPMYKIKVEGPSAHTSNVQAQMNKLKAKMEDYQTVENNTILVYELSMYKSKNIQPTIMTATSGTWSTTLEFCGFQNIEGDPFDEATDLGQRVAEKRVEKKLKPEIDRASSYLDTL